MQTLDTVVVHSVDAVLEMAFVDPPPVPNFTNTGIVGSAFTACERTAINGIYCLDGNVLRNWPDREAPSDTVVDCTDPVLGLDAGKPGACAGMTVESTGAVWISGRKKGNSYSLFRAVKQNAMPTICSSGAPLALTNYCVAEIVTGRKALVSLSSIDGTVGANFEHSKGILALEQGNQAVFFPQPGSPFVIASGKQDWNLVGNESIQSVAVLPFPVGDVDNFVVATTTAGRVLAVEAEGDAGAFVVYNIPANRGMTSQCDFNTPLYGIRASSQSGLAYVTDRQFCQVTALQPVSASGNTFQLTKVPPALSTDAGSETHPPVGPSVAPGINIDLEDCDPGPCTLVLDQDGNAAATLANVSLASAESNMTLFQIKNIPDCRYIPDVCLELLGGTDLEDLIEAGVIVNLDSLSTDNPAAQLFNVTPLLPIEITDLFADSGGLPPMLISRQYRGQWLNGSRFEALFGMTEDGVIFDDTFDGEFDITGLTGSELGCEPTWPPATPIASILAWDIVTTVSERVRTFDDPYIGDALQDQGDPPQFVDTLTNSDCGSSKTAGTRWSLKPYNLEVTPCTFNPDPNDDVWAGDGSCPAGAMGTADDAVMAKLLLQLYDDLGEALNQLACDNVDGQSQPPLSGSSCSALNDQWANGKDKLDKCWAATQQPKQSAGEQNCQSFVTQLNGFSTLLSGVTPQGTDPANRISELKARLATIFHVYEDRFVPSIPSGGFMEP